MVRLNPAKTDEKWNKGNGKGDRESNKRVPLDSSASNSPNGFNRTTIRVPAVVESVNSASGLNFE